MKSVITTLVVAAVAAGIVFVAMGGLNRFQPEPDQDSGTLTTEEDFRNKVAALRRDRQKVLRGIERLETEKAKTLAYLKDKGVTSSADITDDKDVLYALNNLKGWKTEIDKLSGQVKEYDEAISSITAMLDQLKRDQINERLVLTDEQLIDLRKIVVGLDERLNLEHDPLLHEELGKILDEENLDDAPE